MEDSPLGAKGDADSRVQAYCFRFTLSTDPDNRVPITRPENYHPEWYESRARLLQANPSAGCELTQNRMPNKKTDTNHADFVGMSYEYADGDYLSRRNIEDDHKDYVLGLLYFYAYDERVPASVREEMLNYGLAKDEFTENGNFPIQIYLREGRRMVSDYVMKESDVIQNSVPGVIQKTTAPHSVGQGFYWFDSHRVAYFKSESILGRGGSRRTETFGLPAATIRFPMNRIRPVKEECANLYVPVCLSSTHAAYGSIRMETTYMIVGESAGVAAAMSAKEMAEDPAFCVQDLDYASLAIRLAQNGQYLGDIVADDMSKGELDVLKLNILGLTDADGAAVLYEGVKAGFNTPERVGAVKNVLVASANRIAEGTAESETLKILNKFGIISNTASWEGLFGETLPASLPMDNVVSIFDKIAAFFAKESPLGYITDWVNYFAEHGIIDEEARRYFDDNAIGGRTCDTAKTQALGHRHRADHRSFGRRRRFRVADLYQYKNHRQRRGVGGRVPRYGGERFRFQPQRPAKKRVQLSEKQRKVLDGQAHRSFCRELSREQKRIYRGGRQRSSCQHRSGQARFRRLCKGGGLKRSEILRSDRRRRDRRSRSQERGRGYLGRGKSV